MANISRRDARKEILGLLFETEFKKDENTDEIFALAIDDREITEDEYIKKAYFEICTHTDEIDSMIDRHSKGWKIQRMTKVSRSILRLAVYELLYEKDIPNTVSINEAVELAKLYDDEKARSFINGILNSVKCELEADAQ